VLALLAYALLPRGGPPDGLTDAGRACTAVGVWMAVWWMTEAIPPAATSLLPILLLPLLGVCSTKAAAAPFGSDIVFLFLGGFLLGEAMQKWGLHRRLALHVLGAVGASPRRLVLGFMLLASTLSMWVSNTATTLMLVPLGLSVVGLLRTRLESFHDHERIDEAERAQDRAGARNFATCVVLSIAYGASIGGVGTLIGTPPNLVMANTMKGVYDRPLAFAEWMRIGLPTAAALGAAAWVYMVYVAFPIRLRRVPGEAGMIRRELAALGPMGRGEWVVLVTFLGAAAAWIARPSMVRWLGLYHEDGRAGGGRVEHLEDAGIAIAAALLLFLVPVNARRREFVLDWSTAQRLPWGVLLFFGGGLSLAEAMTRTGVNEYLGSVLAGLRSVPTWMIVLTVIAGVVFLTEVASNVAVALALMPVMASAAAALHVHPYLLMFPACLGASLAFMLPVGTPPNAIVYATGEVTIRQMIRAGFRLNLMSIAIVFVMVYVLGSWLLGTDLMTEPDWAARGP
jgi:sodium-dependent dicarboxylate transporter 2/3/5